MLFQSKTNKKIKVLSSDETPVNENNAIVISEKSKSAKSRDSGIEEMVRKRICCWLGVKVTHYYLTRHTICTET